MPYERIFDINRQHAHEGRLPTSPLQEVVWLCRRLITFFRYSLSLEVTSLKRLGPIHKLSFQLFDDLSDETKCLLGLLLPSLTQLALQVPLGTANLKGSAQNMLRSMFAVHPLQQCSGKQRLPNGGAGNTHPQKG